MGVAILQSRYTNYSRQGGMTNMSNHHPTKTGRHRGCFIFGIKFIGVIFFFSIDIVSFRYFSVLYNKRYQRIPISKINVLVILFLHYYNKKIKVFINLLFFYYYTNTIIKNNLINKNNTWT